MILGYGREMEDEFALHSAVRFFAQVPLHYLPVHVLAVGVVVGSQILLNRDDSVIQMLYGQAPEPPPWCESSTRAAHLPQPPACVQKKGQADSRLPSDRLPSAQIGRASCRERV